jgi:hypothetical protein
MVTLVKVRVVDVPFPTNRCAGFLEIGPNHENQLIGKPLGDGSEARGIFKSAGRIVDAARPNDHNLSIVSTVKNIDDFLSGFIHNFRNSVGHWMLFLQNSRWDQRSGISDS